MTPTARRLGPGLGGRLCGGLGLLLLRLLHLGHRLLLLNLGVDVLPAEAE